MKHVLVASAFALLACLWPAASRAALSLQMSPTAMVPTAVATSSTCSI